MPDNVLVGEPYHADTLDCLQQVDAPDESRVAFPRQVHLARIPGHYELGIGPHSGEEHFQLSEIGVLGLVEDHAGPVEGPSPHIGERGDLNRPVCNEFLKLLRRNHISEGIVERLEIRVQLVLHVSRQESQPFSGFHGRTCKYYPFDFPILQCPDSQCYGDVCLAGSRRTCGKNQVAVEICLDKFLLGLVPGPDRLSVRSVDNHCVPVQHEAFGGVVSVEEIFHVKLGQVHLLVAPSYQFAELR